MKKVCFTFVKSLDKKENILSSTIMYNLEGSYDIILEEIISYLDGNSLECCLNVSFIWRDYFTGFFTTPRVTRLMSSHWREFVPVQTEIKYNI